MIAEVCVRNDGMVHLMMMLMTSAWHALTIRRLILIRVAIAWARRCCVTLIIKHHIVRWRRAFQATTFAFQFQIQATLTAATNFVRRPRARESRRLIRAPHHIIVVNQMRCMHAMGMQMRRRRRRIHYICIVIIVTTSTHFRRCDRTLGARHRLQHTFQCRRICRRAENVRLNFIFRKEQAKLLNK